MTRDEYREKCIDAMEDGYRAGGMYFNTIRECLEAAFDALHGIARVCPIEVNDTIAAGRRAAKWACSLNEIWRDMATAGDLTNPPEEKP